MVERHILPWQMNSILIIKMSPFHFGRRKTDVHRTSCALSRKAPKCPVLRHLDYRLGRGIRKIPDCASTSGTLLVASRTLPTIPVFLFFLPNSTLFPKWGKIRQITSLIRSNYLQHLINYPFNHHYNTSQHSSSEPVCSSVL